jgi:hypothetical protein
MVWTDGDFLNMSWHDNQVYSILFGPNEFELSFDLDYILEWRKDEVENIYRFDVISATLIFKNVYDINCSVFSTEVIILDVERENPRSPRNAAYINKEFEYDWRIITTNGEISFTSAGFVQFSRGASIFSEKQAIGRSWDESAIFLKHD